MKILAIMSVLLWGFSSMADTTWGESYCVNGGGQINSLTINWPKPQILKFCYFHNMPTMDLNTLGMSRFNSYGPEANRVYRKTLQTDIMACERNAGFSTQAVDAQGFRQRVCIFFDHSIIGLTTLTDGVSSIWNRSFNMVLGIF